MSIFDDPKLKQFNYKEEVDRLFKNDRILNRVKEFNMTKEQIIQAIPVMIDMYNESMESDYLTSFIITRTGSVQRILIKSESGNAKSFLNNFVSLDIYPMKFENNEFEKDEARRGVVSKFSAILKEQNPKHGLFIYGPMGIGKTFIAKKFAKKLAQEGNTIAFLNVPELAQQMKFNFAEPDANQKLIKKIRNADFLFLDDIGAEIISPWFRDEVLHNLLNHRMNLHKPTFFTSNYNYDELAKVESRVHREKYPDYQKSARLLERIKAQSIPQYLDGKNKRY